MKVAILGSRGIPNRYGGFEELAEKLAVGLANKGHEITVFNPHNHPVKNWSHTGVKIVNRWNPEKIFGSAGQFVYDFFASLHTRFYRQDVILELGYTSSSIWLWLLPSKSRVITNMDGLEWKRTKYSAPVKRFLRKAEEWAGKHSSLLVADNPEIENYLHDRFKNQVVYIPYGADIPNEPDADLLEKYQVEPHNFHLIIARMEPENHVLEILEGIQKSNNKTPVLVVGNTHNGYGRKLKRKFRPEDSIRFLEGIYQKEELNALRHFADHYFHGHSVGGTNPSLLEAMASGCHIVAHQNEFNRSVLQKNARYFSTPNDVAAILQKPWATSTRQKAQRQNLSAVRDKFNWRVIVEQYEVAMQQMLI